MAGASRAQGKGGGGGCASARVFREGKDVSTALNVRLCRRACAAAQARVATPSHAWERPAHSWETRALPLADPSGSESGEEEDLREVSAEEAGDLLVQRLLELHYTNRLSAKGVCVLSWWASKAGACGPVSDFAVLPSSQSGVFQRHLDKVAGVNLRAEQ